MLQRILKKRNKRIARDVFAYITSIFMIIQLISPYFIYSDALAVRGQELTPTPTPTAEVTQEPTPTATPTPTQAESTTSPASTPVVTEASSEADITATPTPTPDAAQAEGDGSWLGSLRGKCAVGNMLLAATDDGLVRVEVNGSSASVTKEFPDTKGFAHAGNRIIPGNGGLYVVSKHEIVHLKIA